MAEYTHFEIVRKPGTIVTEHRDKRGVLVRTISTKVQLPPCTKCGKYAYADEIRFEYPEGESTMGKKKKKKGC